MLRVAAMAAVTVLLTSTTSVEDMAAESPDVSMLCVSKCGTCPVVCSPPPSPPKASDGVNGSPPTKKSPPSPSSSSSSSPGLGGLSYPYYYFYTADAARVPGFFNGLLGLFPLLVLSFWMV